MFMNTLRHRTGRSATAALIATMLAAFAFVFIGSTLTAAPAHALCSGSSPATGTWNNIDPNTRSVTKVVLDWGCADQALCDTSGHCVYPAGTIRVFGKCHPTDCDWGTRRTYAENGGWERATYTYSWATKSVWVRPYQYYGRTYLRVWVHTDFTPADGRQDYTTDEWMLK
jgi:hypothetical protein